MVEYPGTYWKDYELIDSGAGEKLERFGDYVLARPEPKALWDKSLPQSEWNRRAHTVFVPGAGFGRAGKEDSGIWKQLRKMDGQWYVGYSSPAGLRMRLRLGMTSFKHVGIFPEQAPNWEYIYSRTSLLASGGNRPKVLNLFAYTGGTSLAAKSAGADVTHVDSVKPVVTWARENMEASGLDGIRWIVEDALKFTRREVKRGNLYDGIVLDPPAYGRGANGEKWVLEENINELLSLCAWLLRRNRSFLVLNLYSMGLSALLAKSAVRQLFGQCSGEQFGELYFDDSFGKTLPLGVYYRLWRD